MRLHQLKVEFDAAQDRLLMRVSTASSEEALVWLTRRCTIRLWHAAQYGQEWDQL